MWIATTNGFFSAVQDRDDPDVIRVRCRVKEDAEYLVGKMAGLGTTGLRIEEDRYADYLYRVLVPRSAWAIFLMDQSLRVDYGNFKDAVKERQGARRASVYSGVWSELLDLQETRPYSGYGDDFVPFSYGPPGESLLDHADRVAREAGGTGLFDDIREQDERVKAQKRGRGRTGRARPRRGNRGSKKAKTEDIEVQVPWDVRKVKKDRWEIISYFTDAEAIALEKQTPEFFRTKAAAQDWINDTLMEAP